MTGGFPNGIEFGRTGTVSTARAGLSYDSQLYYIYYVSLINFGVVEVEHAWRKPDMVECEMESHDSHGTFGDGWMRMDEWRSILFFGFF